MIRFIMYQTKTRRLSSALLMLSVTFLALPFIIGGSAFGQNVTSTTVTLEWTAPGDNDNSGTATEYDIRYSLFLITESNWASATQATGEPTPQPAGSTETFTVENLEPNTTYYFAIKTADEVPNWSGISNVISRATLEETTPPSAIANLTLNNPTLSSITLHWTAPGDDGTSGKASEYDIRYSTSPIDAGNWDGATQVADETAPKQAGFAESFIVDGLSSGTTYYFAIKTADEVPNWSDISNVPSLATETEQTPPSAIAGLTADNITGNSVRLNWVAPGDDGNSGTAAQYDIRYSTSPISNETDWSNATQVSGEPAPLVAGTAQSFTVTGLEVETNYYFAIKTADEIPNWSDISNVVNTATVDDVPPAAVNDLAAVIELLFISGLV
jgi:phosphodiesterase/alkaline phosphatase D-like protein